MRASEEGFTTGRAATEVALRTAGTIVGMTALELGRGAEDPQVVLWVLVDSARVYAETGDEEAALGVFDEALVRIRALPHLGFSVFNSPAIAWLSRLLGRDDEVEAFFSRETINSRWLDVGRAVLAGDLHGAAELLAEIDAPTLEAFYRLQSGTEEDVRAALDFYRRVGATRYVREGEAMLAASA